MDKIIKEVNDEISNLRKLIYFLDHSLFRQLYKECDDNTRAVVDNAIYLRDTHGIKRWIDEQRSKNLETMSLGDLRELARGLGVYVWHRGNKDQLIAGIINKRKKGKNDNSGRSAAGGPESRENKEGTSQTSAGSESQGWIPPL
jgi:hypothetical protein